MEVRAHLRFSKKLGLLAAMVFGLLVTACGTGTGPSSSGLAGKVQTESVRSGLKAPRTAVTVGTLPSRCRIVPSHTPLSEVPDSGNLDRKYGGKVEVVAQAKFGISAPSLYAQLGELDRYDGNCFYSQHVSTGKYVRLFVGFSKNDLPADPQLVAEFLKTQKYEFTSVVLEGEHP